jgi:hypothetical protein
MATKKAIGLYEGQRKEIPATDMATVKPIVLYENQFKELQAGDTIAGSEGGSINVVTNANPAIEMKSILKAILDNDIIGVKIEQSPFKMLVQETPYLKVVTSVTGQSNQAEQNPAIGISSVNTAVVKTLQTPAFDMQQITYNLNRNVGGNAVVISTANTQGWTNPNNAISGTNGQRDGLNATFAANALATRNGTVILDYSNLVNKSELIISSVKLRFYYKVAGTVLNNADVQLKWNKGNSDIALATITGDKDASIIPDEFDITASISSWADLDTLKTKVVCDAAMAETWTCAFDAAEYLVLASKIDVI